MSTDTLQRPSLINVPQMNAADLYRLQENLARELRGTFSAGVYEFTDNVDHPHLFSPIAYARSEQRATTLYLYVF